FKVKEGATVDELLKKLPGIQVNSKGEITAQGEKVQKVLVDGEEFFGDDPTLVTQNLRADMVDKVQVYDKKSDQAAFTGIDDGQKTKTINLKLKDDKKNGYFGKAEAGGGTDGYYNEQLMFNLFKKKQKLAVYGIASNTGKTGLNWGERDQYGQSIAGMAEYDENNGYFTLEGSFDDLDSWDGQYEGRGYPVVRTGGIHYNNKWNDDRQLANFNYKVMQLSVNGQSGAETQYILPGNLYYNQQQERFSNQIMRHKADGSYEIKFDSTSSIKITADGRNDHKITASHFESLARATDNSRINQSLRDISTTGDGQSFNSNVIWRKRLPKKGRTLSVNFSEKFERNSSGGYLYAQNDFFKADTLNDQQITDQYKNYHSEKTQLDSKITYTEPLSGSSFITANYGISVSNNRSDRSSFNKSSTGKYTDLDPVYSNDYRFNVFTQLGGLNYSLVKKKLRIVAGNTTGFTGFTQQDLHADTSITRRFVNWYPQALFMYSFTQQKRLSLRYNGGTSQPTIQQVQPTRTNDDPLNVAIGNPGLKPQFRNNLSFNYNDYKVLTERNIWSGINYNWIQNFIGTSEYTDSSRKRTYQSVNLNGQRSLRAYMGYGFKWQKLKLNISFNGNLNLDRAVNIVNNVPNTTNSGSGSFGIDFWKQKEKKYEFGLSVSASYTRSVSSILENNTTSYWTYHLQPNAMLYLPLKFELRADADINLRPKTALFTTNNNVAILNGSIGKKLLKKDQLLVRLSANDLLNQNTGFNRTVNSNYIMQNTYSTIQRYFMVSLVWNFNKAGTPAPQQ
ncbi:MAG TPA: outer membrane beta-barrel protein, partial [Chitinophagaceae bacterium]|nr:outer membrane beta-barrel protein [Chitinophagaceae bacterium]